MLEVGPSGTRDGGGRVPAGTRTPRPPRPPEVSPQGSGADEPAFERVAAPGVPRPSPHGCPGMPPRIRKTGRARGMVASDGREATMTPEGVGVGIDVAQATLVVAVHGGEPPRTVADGRMAELIARVRPWRRAGRAGGTGGLERPLAAALAGAGLPVAVVNPRQARDFAGAGQLAKTDRLDARVLARFAEAVRPVRPVPDPGAPALAALLARRRQVMAMLIAEQHRLPSAPASRARR